ncbi:MAG: acylphosphatase [Candidatus Omnitrophica bacterium]|nr:acylphosphatase [Candidatus Omnitrophota bacterium]MDD5430313.1 acylphosphatase [Candidatus Omnitrophota bacterium]
MAKDKGMNLTKTVHVFYSGLVQGVGFRFSACQRARNFNVKGWVKNLNDGRVELMAQGSPRSVGGFLEALRDEFSQRFSDVNIEEFLSQEVFSEFQIRWY